MMKRKWRTGTGWILAAIICSFVGFCIGMAVSAGSTM